jgi:hypothetical protein
LKKNRNSHLSRSCVEGVIRRELERFIPAKSKHSRKNEKKRKYLFRVKPWNVRTFKGLGMKRQAYLDQLTLDMIKKGFSNLEIRDNGFLKSR